LLRRSCTPRPSSSFAARITSLRLVNPDTTRLIWLLSMPAARARSPSECAASAAPSSAMVRHSHRLTPNSRR
jgi:hypothetical protein